MSQIKCFISYSWDNISHKEWVLKLATHLCKNGVFVFLDQWDIRPGADLAKYMESSVRDSDFVLLICTPCFAEKSNSNSGGVGYEKMVITGELFNSSHQPSKFIPILRKGNPDCALPSYLKSKIYIDFQNDKSFNERLFVLLRHIFNSPLHTRPSIGFPPFAHERVTKSHIDDKTEVQNVRAAHQVGPIRRFAIEYNIGSLDFSPDGKTAVTGVCEKGIAAIIWDLSTGQELSQLNGDYYFWCRAKYASEGRKIVIGCGPCSIGIDVFNVTTGSISHRMEDRSGQYFSYSHFDISPGDKYVAAVGNGSDIFNGPRKHSVWLWEYSNGKLLNRFEVGSTEVKKIALDQTGCALIGTSTELFWIDLFTGKILTNFKYDILPEAQAPVFIDLSQNGKYVLSCNRFERYPNKYNWDKFSHEVFVWRTHNGQLVSRLEHQNLSCGCFFPESERILTGDRDGLLVIWDTLSGHTLYTLGRHMGYINEIIISNDGNFALSCASLSGGIGREVILWRLPK